MTIRHIQGSSPDEIGQIDEFTLLTNEKTQTYQVIAMRTVFRNAAKNLELCKTMHFIRSIDNHGMLTECFCCSYSQWCTSYVYDCCLEFVE